MLELLTRGIWDDVANTFTIPVYSYIKYELFSILSLYTWGLQLRIIPNIDVIDKQYRSHRASTTPLLDAPTKEFGNPDISFSTEYSQNNRCPLPPHNTMVTRLSRPSCKKISWALEHSVIQVPSPIVGAACNTSIKCRHHLHKLDKQYSWEFPSRFLINSHSFSSNQDPRSRCNCPV